MSTRSWLRCQQAALYLSAFADGELAEPLRARVAAHVADCQACAQRLADNRRVDDLLRTLPPTRPTPAVLDSVLAAIADPQATREPLHRSGRALVPRRRIAAISAPSRVPSRVPSPYAAPRRAGWVALVPPTLAAVLLISFALLAFDWARTRPYGAQISNATPTPASLASVLQQTRQAVAGSASQLSFTPVLPSYLPTSAQLDSVRTEKANATAQQPQQTYLDVTWRFSAGTVCQVHLREAPKGLGWIGYTPGSPDARLSWQLTNRPWRPLNLLASSERPAVGQDRGAFTIALDAAPCSVTASADDAIANLRLISLSLDMFYQPVVILPISVDGRVLHTTEEATTPGGALLWRREVYTSADQREQRVDLYGANGTLLTTSVIRGQQAIQIIPASQEYISGAPSRIGGLTPLPSTEALRDFYSANTLADQGYLWNRGLGSYRGLSAFLMALVNAPAPTLAYVDISTDQVLAITVTPTPGTRPGGPLATSPFTTSACASYTLLEYLAPEKVSGGGFSLQPPAGYHVGTNIATPPGCP
ncbi:MAG: zf-HC2 domain-containing protein [Ktedonobacterales bacterium]|nr:zf-HC2 domain-containing protein [Ktedonobacterales bacterium]